MQEIDAPVALAGLDVQLHRFGHRVDRLDRHLALEIAAFRNDQCGQQFFRACRRTKLVGVFFIQHLAALGVDHDHRTGRGRGHRARNGWGRFGCLRCAPFDRRAMLAFGWRAVRDTGWCDRIRVFVLGRRCCRNRTKRDRTEGDAGLKTAHHRRASYWLEPVTQANRWPKRVLQIAAALDQFNLVTFRRINESNHAAAFGPVRSVGKRITLGRRFPRELFEIIHLEGEMSQVRPDDYGSALIELAELDFFIAFRRSQKNKLRTAARGVAASLLQSEDVLVKCDRFFQIGHAITSV